MALADAGANIVPLDQDPTQQIDGMLMLRTIFHLPGLAAARDAIERDFAASTHRLSTGQGNAASHGWRNGSLVTEKSR